MYPPIVSTNRQTVNNWNGLVVSPHPTPSGVVRLLVTDPEITTTYSNHALTQTLATTQCFLTSQEQAGETKATCGIPT